MPIEAVVVVECSTARRCSYKLPNLNLQEVRRIATETGVDLVQLHGNEGRLIPRLGSLHTIARHLLIS